LHTLPASADDFTVNQETLGVQFELLESLTSTSESWQINILLAGLDSYEHKASKPAFNRASNPCEVDSCDME
jgi:hypothetical protein